MVNELGDGLTVVIDAQHNWVDDWMSFALWYSCSKNIPDAAVAVAVTAPVKECRLFGWAGPVNVPVVYTNKLGYADKIHVLMKMKKASGVVLVAKPSTLVVRELDDETLAVINTPVLEGCINVEEKVSVPAGDDRLACFVTYAAGWGKFVVREWIDTSDVPFANSAHFLTESSNANEIRIARLWRQLEPLYTAVSRG